VPEAYFSEEIEIFWLSGADIFGKLMYVPDIG
jgi:hypothetical protein